MARDMHLSTLAVAEQLGIDLQEPKGWTCCGATAGHQTDSLLAVSLPAATLVKVQDQGLDLVANCAACYNRLKMANHLIRMRPDIRQKTTDAIGRDYDGSVRIRHFIEVLLEDVGLDVIQNALKCTLNGLKVACYYGCLLVRPHEAMQFDDPENPTSLDRLVQILGAETLEWSHKVECCGGGFSMTRTDVVIRLTNSILSMAKLAGANCIVVSCPMCQINLDMRQLDIRKQMGKQYDMPIVYVTQLIGLCLGISADKLGFNKLMIPASTVIESVGDAA
jgi:heterodisulfide reductase subunit B